MNCDSDGFVLVEVVVTIAIIAILILPVVSVMVSAVKTSERGSEMMNASLIGQKYMELLKNSTTNIREGEYFIEEGDFDVAVSVEPFSNSSDGCNVLLWKALVSVEWEEDSIMFESLIWNRR